MNNLYMYRRSSGPRQAKPSTSCAVKLLSLLVITTSIALGFTIIIIPLRSFHPSGLPVLLQPKGKQATVTPANSPAAAIPLVLLSGGQKSPAKLQEFPEPGPDEIARLRRAAKVLDPELMTPVPETFDPKVKNPCWVGSDGEFRCLPYSYITGMFHAGAQSLANKLRMHPDILTDDCSGCQFWGEEGKSMAYYLDNMKLSRTLIKAAPNTKVLMDSSPSTFAFYWAGGGKAHRGFADAMRPCHGQCVEGLHRDKVPVDVCMDKTCYNVSMAADLARAAAAGIDYDKECHNPLLVRAVYGARPPKMILVARDPIARLYSAFHGYPHYYGKYGKSSAGFTAYVKDQVGALRTCAEQFGERRCALLFEALSSREEKVYFHADQLMRGMYGLFLEIWYHSIPPSNWLVIHSDDLFKQPKATLARVVDFLGVSKVDDAALERMAAAGAAPSYTTGQEPIQQEARDLLRDLYAPYNTLLAKMTGDARFEAWNTNSLQA